MSEKRKHTNSEEQSIKPVQAGPVEPDKVEPAEEEEPVRGEREEREEGREMAVSTSALYESLAKMYDLPWEARRELIPPPPEGTLTERAVELATRIAKYFGLPLTGVNVIMTKAGPTVYTNYSGILYKLQVDARGLKSSTADIVHRPTPDEPYVIAKAEITFENGARFDNIGVVYVDMSRPQDIPNAIMKAVTKAKRRAGRDAVGTGLPPIYEEYLDYIQEKQAEQRGTVSDYIDAEYEVMPAGRPTNLAELISLLNKRGMSLQTIMEKLGVSELSDIDLEKAWQILEAGS